MNTNLRHTILYESKIRPYKIASIIFSILCLVSIALIMLTSSDAEVFGISCFVLICSISLLAAFLILYFMGTRKARESGSYEAIDIVDNKIVHMTEKAGQTVLGPQDIEWVSLTKNTHHTDDIYYDIKIKSRNSSQVFAVSRWVSDYKGLVREMRAFKQSNNIPG